jgi:hypothetical protein
LTTFNTTNNKKTSIIMKKSSTLKYLLTFLTLVFFMNQGLFSQACGNITLSTQAQVNAFACSSITGDLVINDGGTGNITDLDPIWQNGMQNATVTGSVTVQNCPGLPDLYGLDGITSIGGNFSIVNCPNVTSLVRFGGNLALQNIGGFLVTDNVPRLTDLSAFGALTSIGSGISLQNQLGASDFSGFNALTSSPVIEFFLTNVSRVNGFNNLSSCGYFRFINNSELTSITGFNSLQTVKPTTSANGNVWNLYQIQGNSKLNSFTAHPNLVSTTQLNVSNNPQLSTCCFLLDLIAQNPSPLNISGNAFGCASVAQINAPPTLTACPADVTVQVGPGNCVGSFSAQSPIASDNCDLDTYFRQLDIANGGGASIIQIPPSGNNETFPSLPQGTSQVTYLATDANNQTTSCSFQITVEDNIPPVISNIPPDVTINCNDLFPSIPSPLFTDNCDPSPVLSATSSVSTGPCGEGEIVETQSYTWNATDASGNMTSKNWTVTRVSDFSFNLGPDVTVCDGSSYVIDPFIAFQTYQWSTGATSQALSVSSSGTYSLTITTPNGCCYVDEINVNIIAPPDATATGATLDCGATSVQIMGSSSIPGVSYSWTGPGGFTSADQNPTVPSIGDYILTVTTPEGCVSTATATVTGATDVPNASAAGGTIDCATTSVQLSGNSTSAGVTYSWSGPDGFSSNDQNPVVTVPGLYVLSVTGSNGCAATADAEVLGDTMAPMPSLPDGLLTCNDSALEYTVEGTAIWSGPSGFASLQDSVSLSSPGIYMVTVTAANSCSSVTSFEITQDTMPPNISAEGGVISCALGQDTLMGNSTTAGATFEWSGPGGFATSIQNPIAATIGTYTLIVTSPNGCTASQDVELTASLDAPQVEVSAGSIDCINTTLDLFAISGDAGLTYSWIGPNGFTATGDSIQVSVPGNYTVNAENEDGCVGSAVAEVIDNAQIPDVEISANNLNCQEGATKFTTTVSENVITYNWTGPNNFVSTDKEPEVTMEGLYTLIVTAENGCTNMDTLTLISDVEIPTAMAVGGMLTCTQNTIEIVGSTSTENTSFKWSGPEGFTSLDTSPIVSVPGTYYFTVTAQNGCTAIDSAEVIGDPDLPIVNATGGVIDCTNDEVMLVGSTSSEGASIRWDGPNGYVSFSNTPIVDLPGEYTFTVTSTGNCVAFTSVEVIVDKRDPNLSIAEGFIDCDAGVREFNAVTNIEQEGTFTWTGPDGFTSNLLNPLYTKAGTYMLTVTGANGCFTSGVIEVADDIPYDANLVIEGNDASVEITGGTDPFTVIFDDNIEATSVMDLSDGEHFVQITDGLGCDTIIQFTIMSSSVFDQDDLLEVKVYPNPAQDILNIDWQESDLQAEKISIMNSSGQVQTIEKVSGKNHQLNIDQYPSGIYYLKIEGKEKLAFKKFLKM